ncbi:helix-turn-helix domain-containing protein [uncultured Algoriphagus sp.]|uniref:helix-turn-helix domain-containing protein n=1 Tax=uncultured Algoriphagus sp. TaxID=417365 RepID=UPI0025982F8E|nr:helix-turn-helix domain-containing protein [uncultured Algoriphagus sp.]
MEYNLYIFTFSSFLLLAFSLHMIFTNNGNTYLNKLLAAMMLMRGLQILYFLAVITGQTFFVSFIINSLGPFLFVYGAIFYLYVRGFIRDESQWQKKDLLHFIPFLLAIIDTIPWYFLDSGTRAQFISDMIRQRSFFVGESFGIVPYYVSSIFRNGLLVTYFVLAWRLVFKSAIIEKRRKYPVATNWILFFLLITSLSNLSMIVNFLINISIGASSSNLFLSNYRIYIQSTILLGFFVYVLYNPKVLYGFVFVSKDFTNPKNLSEIKKSTPEKYDRLLEIEQERNLKQVRKQAPSFRDEEISRYKAQMILIMENQKPFLNPEFSLGDLANQVGLPNHHCSFILNEYFQKNFREWVNRYRVDYFISQYHSLIASQTIASIALESGFKNKNTFYSAFEKATGKTPSQYFV